MRTAFLLLLLLVVCTVVEANGRVPMRVTEHAGRGGPAPVGDVVPDADFAFLLPGEVLKQKFAQELPLLAALIQSNTLPTSCCYDNVGAKAVHLDFTSIKYGSVKPEGDLNITTAGMAVQVGAEVEIMLNYRLCLHDDPFGHGCSTLYGCKGDGKQVTINGLGSVLLDISADTKGMPLVTPSGETFAATEASDDICGKINDQIRGELGQVSANIQKLIGPMVASEVAKILGELPGTIPVGNDTAVQWTIDNSTETLNDALQIVGDMTVLATKDGNKPGPFPPTGGIPLVAPDGKAHLLIHECVLSNFVWAMYDEGLLTKNITLPFPEGTLGIVFGLKQAPTMSIAAGAAGPVVHIDADMQWSINGTFQFQLDASMDFDTVVEINAAGDYAMVQLKGVVIDSIQLEIYANHTVVDESWIDNILQFLITLELPKANAILAAKHLPLPSFKSFKLSNPAISFLNNTVAISADIAPAFSASTAMWTGLPGKAIECPNIGDKDGCI